MRKPLIHTHCHLICCVYIKGCVSIHIVWCWGYSDTWIQEIKAMSKMVLAAFTQHCIQSTVTHLTHVEDIEDAKIVLCIQGLSPLQGGRLFIWAFHPVGLAVHHQSVWGGSFVVKHSGTCQTTMVIAGKMHSQSPILKTKGHSATQ